MKLFVFILIITIAHLRYQLVRDGIQTVIVIDVERVIRGRRVGDVVQVAMTNTTTDADGENRDVLLSELISGLSCRLRVGGTTVGDQHSNPGRVTTCTVVLAQHLAACRLKSVGVVGATAKVSHGLNSFHGLQCSPKDITEYSFVHAVFTRKTPIGEGGGIGVHPKNSCY